MMDETAMIGLAPTHAGYRVYVAGVWIGSLLLRVYEGNRRVADGTVLATPAALDAPSQRFGTIGTALDYLLGCPVEVEP